MDSDIVISGISGRFPSSNNLHELSYKLFNKIDLVDNKETRWKHIDENTSSRMGKINNLDKFDASFFSVHSRHARSLDPAARLLLEHSYEAIIDAGIAPKTLHGSRTGVYIGNFLGDSDDEEIYSLGSDGSAVSGLARALFANRISFALGLIGPSLTVDTACSSSMYALDLAYNDIKIGKCDAALVGGSNVILDKKISEQYFKLGVGSKQGFTRTFDKDADGFTRAEVVSVIFLQKSRDAKRIYANVIYSKTNNDGYKTEGVTFPSSKMQAQLLREFYNDIKMSPLDVKYVEAHGTATRIGDPQECKALAEVFCKGRDGPLLVGSVKSSMGHSEASAGIASIAKTIIALENKQIPPNINLHEINPRIPSLTTGQLKVVTEVTNLESSLIGINCFGLGGANSHALLRGNDKSKINNGAPIDNLPRLVLWSGRTKEAVDTILDSISERSLDAEYIALLHNTQLITSPANIYRGYGIFAKNENGNASNLNRDIQQLTMSKRPIVWIYSGMGSQNVGMGMDLMKIPIFANAIENCHNILVKKGINLKEIITSSDPTTFDNILHSFVGIAAIQIALTDVLKALKIEPDYLIGHSVGELGCAYADGCFTAEEMILSSYSRGMASNETETIFGSMAAVGLGYDELKSIIPDDIIIACHNSPNSCTISGPAENVAEFVETLKAQKVFAKEVACSNIPFHSGYIAEMGPKLYERIVKIIKEPKKRSSRWISSSVPHEMWNVQENQISSANYHTNNLLRPVLFEEATRFLPKDAITIEIAPHALLQAVLRKALPEAMHIGLTKRGCEDNSMFLINALGKLFQNGIDFDASQLYPPIEFPVSRNTSMISPYIKWDHSESHYCVQKQRKYGKCEEKLNINITDQEYAYFSGHMIDGRVLLPGTGYIVFVWQAFAKIICVDYRHLEVEFSDVKLVRATTLIPDQSVQISIVIHKGTGNFEVTEGTNIVMSGIIKAKTSSKLSEIKPQHDDNVPVLKKKDIYKEVSLRGYQYKNAFRSLEAARADGLEGNIKWNNNWITFMDCMLQMALIGKDSRGLYLPTMIRRIVINPNVHNEIVNVSESKVLEAYYCPNLKLFRSGGIEIQDLDTSFVNRRISPSVPVLESYQFVPYCTAETLSLPNMARFCCQLLLEIQPSLKVTTVEIDSDDDKEPMSPYFSQALNDLPLIKANTNYLTEQILDIAGVTVSNNNLAGFNDVSFIIKSNAKEKAFLEEVCQHFGAVGFIISREFDRAEHRDLPAGYEMIAQLSTDDDEILVLKYSQPKKEQKRALVKVSECDKIEWLDDLKKAMRIGPVIAYSQNDKFSGLLGLVNCIRKEGGNISCIIIDDEAPVFDPENEFYKTQLNKGLPINIFKNGQWGSYKHFKLRKCGSSNKCVDHYYANYTVRGDLSTMTWLEGPHKKEDMAAKNMINVHYASLNFKDVMHATGRLPVEATFQHRLDQSLVLGMELSGTDVNGKRVMGMVIRGAMSNVAFSDTDFVWEVPDDWSLEEAATVPMVYGTVYYALFIVVHIQKGKSILIHAGSGGIGLAAIHVAFAYGLDVYTTVSTEEKKKFLLNEFPQLKSENIGNSRDTSFEEMIMMRTNGKGVDFILNSLADEKLQASIRCLSECGKFLEIGKFDMINDSKIGMKHLLKQISIHSVMMEYFFNSSSEQKMHFKDLISQGLRTKVIKPLNATVFDASNIESAFRYLASGKHIGKVLLKMRQNEDSPITLPLAITPRIYCDPQKSYIICGGLGGFGLELADWMVLRGCRKLILSSRNGITNAYQAYRIRIWESYGVQVQINKSDITKREGCENLINQSIVLGKIGGIYNLAVLLRDGLLDNQDFQKFVECLGPKAIATKYLDELSRELCSDLDQFVVFSSVSCGRGNAGQSNYGMANSVMERIIEKRCMDGLKSKAVQWGAVGDVGLVAEMNENHLDLEIGGTLQQSISSCLDELDNLLSCEDPVVASMIVAEKRFKSTVNMSALDTVLHIMSIRDVEKISMEMTLSELGMDSMMAVEMQQVFEREYDITLSASELQAITLTKLIKLADETKSGTKKKVATTETNEDLHKLLIRNFGNEQNSTERILKLKDFSESCGTKALIIPGIESQSSEIWKEISEKLKFSTYILQTAYLSDATSVDEICQEVKNDVLNFFTSSDEYFFIISYSFGTLIALELAELLENLGKGGNVILIDGTPEYLEKLANLAFSNDTEESIRSKVLAYAIAKYLPNNSSEALSILAEPTWEEKLVKFAGYQKFFSVSYCIAVVKSIVNRIMITKRNELKLAHRLENSAVTLIKCAETAVQNISDDYGISMYNSNPATKFEYKIKNTNHQTILESSEIIKIINEYHV